jgi:hypothetical protein
VPARRRRGAANHYQSPESQFLAEHSKQMEQYSGEWLLIHGYALLAHSVDFQEIERVIQQKKIPSPFVHYVPRAEEISFVA